jgi:C-terminal processing protease CtpA/Prc
MLRGWINTTVTVSFRTPDGRTDKLELIRNREGVDWLKSRELYHELVEFKWLDDKVAYVALNSFNNDQVVEDFEALLPDLYDADGVILDLRNNGGGNTGIGSAILAHFTSDTLRGSAWKTREHVAAYKAWGQWADQSQESEQYRPYFEGTAWHEGEFHELAPAPGKKIEVPFIVLIGHMTGSAAEDFLIYADALDQATYVGRPSTGSTGQPLHFKLPGGGGARICTKRDTYPDGREFVGYGVQPHVPVEPTVESFLSGEDITLQKGIEVLKEKIAEVRR